MDAKRLLLVACVACAAIGVAAEPAAWAHGGTFRNPGGAVPPGLQPPSDPTPPPPPPATGTPSTPSAPPASPPPAPVTPPATPPAGPPVTGLPEGGTRPRTAAQSGDSWTYWWAYNDAGILRLKEEIYRLRATPGSPLAEIGAGRGNRSAATRATAKGVRDSVVPALLEAMDPARRLSADARSAAYLALAKVTDDPTHVARLLRGVYAEDGSVNVREEPVVRESAALSLGLLRRGDPARRLDAKDLDRARDAAFAAFEDTRLATRIRAFAMFSVGLLGDQPTAHGLVPTTGEGSAPGGPTAAARIFSLLHATYAQDDLPVSLLLALSLQPETSVTPEMVDCLRDLTMRGRLGRGPVSPLVSSYAALALGRVGTPDQARALLSALRANSVPVDVQRSAAIALGRLGSRADVAARQEIAAGLVRACEEARDAMARDFAVMSLADVLAADVNAGRSDVLDSKGPSAADALVRVAATGNYSQRPFGALAAGIVARAIGETPDVLAYGALRARLLEVLRAGLKDPAVDARSRGAFAIGLGLSRDEGSRSRLVALLSDSREDSELRGYAAVAAGMVADASPDVVRAVEKAMSGRPPEELRLQCAVALGLLGAPDAVDLLLRELESAPTENVKGQVVLALGKIGDERALPPLVAMLRDELRPDLTRAMACAGLGLVGDLETVPSLARLSTGLNYRAGCDAIAEVLSIL